MPDKYDRAICATELRLRNEILEKVRTESWRPTDSFEIPVRNTKIEKAGIVSDDESPSMSSTSETSTASHLKEEIDISDLYSGVVDTDGSKGYV